MAHSLEENENAPDVLAGYQTLYALESYLRYQQGENTLFDLTDAQSVENSAPQQETSKMGQMAGILIALAVLILIVVVVLVIRNSHNSKKQKEEKLKKVQEAEEQDDWN